jgi:hypothetical protein
MRKMSGFVVTRVLRCRRLTRRRWVDQDGIGLIRLRIITLNSAGSLKLFSAAWPAEARCRRIVRRRGVTGAS